MLIVLDTTELLADPACCGVAWHVVAHASATQELEVLIPEVVIVEAVAGAARSAQEAKVGLSRWLAKHGPRLGGMAGSVDRWGAEIDVAAESYEATLREKLSSLGVRSCHPIDVDHLDVVKRAALRRPPCNAEGDGYRDTLNWLTLLKIAANVPAGQRVCWVSRNWKDFATEDEQEQFRPELAAEIEELGLTDRLVMRTSLGTLLLSELQAYASGPSDGLASVRTGMLKESVDLYIRQELSRVLPEMSIDRRSCGLPFATVRAKLGVVESIDAIPSSSVAASVKDGFARFEVGVTCLLNVEVLAVMDQPLVALDDVSKVYDAYLSKKLVAEGMIALDEYKRPVSLEVSRIQAPDDDPGRTAWAMRDHAIRQGVLPLVDPSIAEAVKMVSRMPLMDPSIAEAVKMVSRMPLMDPSIAEAVKCPRQAEGPDSTGAIEAEDEPVGRDGHPSDEEDGQSRN